MTGDKTTYNDVDKYRELFLEALSQTANNISLACDKIGRSRQWYYNQMDDPRFRVRVEDQMERDVDLAETQLKQLIRKGDTTACIFFLKTRGKHRGYVERFENTGADGGPIRTASMNLNMEKELTNDELRQLARELKSPSLEALLD